MANSPQQFNQPAQYSTQQIPGTVYENLDQDIIHITADRALLYLREWRQKIESQGSWIAPLSLAASLLLALLTADFKDRFGLPKERWAAFFVISFLATIGWLISSVRRRLLNSAETPDQVVQKFKKMRPLAS